LNSGESKEFSFDEWMPSSNNFIYYDNKFHFISGENNWTISLDGNITRNSIFPKYLLDKHTSRTKQLSELHQKMLDSWVQLKNVQQLFINDNNNFVFNTHELYINSNGVIKLDQSSSLDKVISAQKISKHKFLFAEGSTIQVKGAGLIILKSSNIKIPCIYIPSVLDSNLGLATADAFAGNHYYFKPRGVKVILQSVGSQPLHIVKLIKEFAGIGLNEAKSLVDNSPSCISQKVTQSAANEIKKNMEFAGAVIILEENDKDNVPAMIESLSSQEFFNRYIHAFINTIKNGTKH
ncbi:MAG: ribosomal protein L7/L12, partial [Flavobacterium sp.]